MTIIRTDKRLRPRSKSDYYPTPSEAARAALNLIDMDKVAYVLDTGAGNGVWGTELKKINKYAYLYGVEIQNGKYYDTGSKLEYMKTVVDLAKQQKQIPFEVIIIDKINHI